MSFAEGFTAWREQATFRTFYNQFLAELDYLAFFWEHPGLTVQDLEKDYEVLVVLSDRLAQVDPNPQPFTSFWREKSVSIFPNLGRDALLVSPKPTEDQKDFSHLANFVRNAEEEQIQFFWQEVGRALPQALHTEYPLWLNTSGLGVHWLHVRLDRRPKYYTYPAYRNSNYLEHIP